MGQHLLLPAVVGVGFCLAAAVLAVLCLFRRKKSAADAQNNPSSDLNEAGIEEADGRTAAFSFDDPYHSIDISYDVITLSSADSGGDSAIEGSPNGSGQNIQAGAESKEPAAAAAAAAAVGGSSLDSSRNAERAPVAQSPTATAGSSNDSNSSQRGEFATDEPVYEMIAFEHNGEVNHSPSPSAMASALQRDASSSSLQTYEMVEGGQLTMPPPPPPPPSTPVAAAAAAVVAAIAARQTDPGKRIKSESSSVGNDDVFEDDKDDKAGDDEDPLYSPVYESTYVDCLSSSQNSKDSGVLLEMLPSPTRTTTASSTSTPSPERTTTASTSITLSPGAPTAVSLIRKFSAPCLLKKDQDQDQAAAKKEESRPAHWRSNSTCGAVGAGGGGGGDGGSWAAIKARINLLKRLKNKSTSSTSPLVTGSDASSLPPSGPTAAASGGKKERSPGNRGGLAVGGDGSSSQGTLAVSGQSSKLPESGSGCGVPLPGLPEEPADACAVQSPTRLPEDLSACDMTPRGSLGQSLDGSFDSSTPRAGMRPKPAVPPKPPRKMVK